MQRTKPPQSIAQAATATQTALFYTVLSAITAVLLYAMTHLPVRG